MLEKLRIRNFQKHRKLDLVFNPGVTTVIGPSDSGKSAVYRALKLVCLNKPAGTAFITAGEESSKVTLYFDRRKVSRSRGGPKLNTYGLDAATYQAMGAEVPDKVREALGITALNFQSQHDAAYWFGEADSKVAKELNAIVNLGEIDELFTRLNADLRKAKAEYDVRVQNVDALRTKKREVESALDLDAALRVLETLDDEIRTEEAKASTLNTLIEAAECARVSRSELKALMKSLDVVRAAGDEAAAEWKRTDAFGKLVVQADTLKRQLGVVPDTTGIAAAHDAWQSAENETARLTELLDTLRDNFRTRKAAKLAHDDATAAAEASKPEVCTKCGQPITNSHKHE